MLSRPFKFYKDWILSLFVDTSTHITPEPFTDEDIDENDIGKVRGHSKAKIGLMIAAYARLNVLLIGPPGEGKSFLVQSLSSILPQLTPGEALETHRIYNSAGLSWERKEPPIISVGPSITPSALLGGGSRPIPGMISLAHNGVLFIDELNELPRKVVESLRIPLETKRITHRRGGISATYQCNFQLIAACNPCPCGFNGYESCNCTWKQLQSYDAKLSGPLLDRIDMVIYLDRVGDEIFDPPLLGQSQLFRNKIRVATEFRESMNRWSSYIKGDEFLSQTSSIVNWSPKGFAYFTHMRSKHNLSIRRLTRLGRIARAIADFTQTPEIEAGHVESARQYLGKY